MCVGEVAAVWVELHEEEGAFFKRRPKRRALGKARQRQRENKTKEGSNNREQLLSCVPLM